MHSPRDQLAVLAKEVAAHVNDVVAPLAARLAALEARPVEKGDAGEPGVPGPQGEIGPPGPAGPAGPQGEAGALGLVPPDLAEQINSVKQMLLERLPVAPPVAPAPERPPELRHVTGQVITRDGHLAVFYSDGTSEKLGKVTGEQGPPGPQGPTGPAGRDGIDGAKGDEGRRGRDGVSVASTDVRHGELMITMSDGTVHLHRIAAEKKRA